MGSEKEAAAPRPRLTRKVVRNIALAGVALFVLAQAVPYGWSHTNPPVTKEAPWPTPASRQLAVGGCYSCHSNLTKWPAYTRVAPGSWLIANDVNGGRNNLNFSEWNKPQPALSDVVEAISGGGMPPLQYKVIHSSGRLTQAERARLVAAVKTIYATDPPQIRVGGGG